MPVKKKAVRTGGPVNETLELLARLARDFAAPESLTAAAGAGDLRSVRAFLEAGHDIEERSVGFSSPLQAATVSGEIEVVGELLARGAGAGVEQDAAGSPMASALTMGHVELFRLLLDAVGDAPADRFAVVAAAGAGLGDELNALLDRGGLQHGRYALQAAAEAGAYSCVRLLLDRGVGWREYPMLAIPQRAAARGHREIVSLLNGEPHDEAAARRAEDALLEKRRAMWGAHAARRGQQRAHGDMRAGLLTRVTEAVRAGALAECLDAPVIDVLGAALTPLMAGAMLGDEELLRALLEAGAKARVKVKGRTARDYLRGPGKLNLARILDGP